MATAVGGLGHGAEECASKPVYTPLFLCAVGGYYTFECSLRVNRVARIRISRT